MRAHIRDDSGFAITTLLLIVSVATSVIVGGSSTVAAVANRDDIQDATGHMDYVAADIQMRTKGDDSARAQALRTHAEKMNAVSDAMMNAADREMLVAIRNNVGDAVLTPLQGGKVITAAKFAWDYKTGYELGDTAMKSWGITDPGTDAVIEQLQDMQLARDYDKPVEQAIAEAKLRGTKVVVAQADPGLDADEVAAWAAQMVVDIETQGGTASAGAGPFENRFVDDDIARQLGWMPPDDAAVDRPSIDTPDADVVTSTGADEWVKFLFSAPGTYWPGGPSPSEAEQAIRGSAEGFLGATPDSRYEVLGIGPTDGESGAWPVRFRMAAPDSDGKGWVFLTLVYASDDGYFASPIFMPDLVGGAIAGVSSIGGD